MTDLPSAELLERCRRRDAAAEEALFQRYAGRLLRLAQSRLSSRLAARLDAEDVVNSAYRSFFRLAGEGEIVLSQSGDLWRLLARITVRKVCRNVRRHRADCRSIDREAPWPEADNDRELAVLSREPTPAEAAALWDEVRIVLEPMGPTQRRMIEMRLQGFDVEEIAANVKRSGRTVRRALAAVEGELVRRLHAPEPPAGQAVTCFTYGDIVLQQQLGAGGMGKVYRARLRENNAPVAVKILRKPLRHHPTAAARFLREAGILAGLHHPGIVVVHGLGLLPDGGHFLVMDLVEGSDLRRAAAAGVVPVERALDWVRQAADAIEHAHQQGVVHCDLKPANLLLDETGRVRVVDFGLARSFTEAEGVPLGGTPGFLAPEQLDPTLGPVSAQTDVHGLGAVLYALLTGQPPFASATEAPSLQCDRSPPELAQRRPDVPAGVQAICRRCLAVDPADRFATAAAVAEALAAELA
jgi:RNA polymerase sigma factor (sigma-70 family)